MLNLNYLTFAEITDVTIRTPPNQSVTGIEEIGIERRTGAAGGSEAEIGAGVGGTEAEVENAAKETGAATATETVVVMTAEIAIGFNSCFEFVL
jgi:hypothetical protein